jgi:hypothetical protein
VSDNRREGETSVLENQEDRQDSHRLWMPSNLKHEGGESSGGDSWNSTRVLLRPSRIPHSHYRTGARGSIPDGSVEPYQNGEDYGAEPDYQHPAPYSIPNYRSSSHSQKRSRSRPSTPPAVDLGHASNDGDYWNTYGLDLGGGPSSSSSLGGLPGIGHKKLARGRLRRLNIHELSSSIWKGLNIWKLLIRILVYWAWLGSRLGS